MSKVSYHKLSIENKKSGLLPQPVRNLFSTKIKFVEIKKN